MAHNRTLKLSIFLFAPIIYCTLSCRNNAYVHTEPERLQREITTIDSLLRSPAFAASLSRSLDSVYYAGTRQAQPKLLLAGEDTQPVYRRMKDEKVAIGIAGFYALECGVGLLCAQTNQTPVEWLHKIATGNAGSSAVLLLNRFANATWKAGQPFRDLTRITRYNFTVAGLLSDAETKKDSIQIRNAAVKLLTALDNSANSPLPQQMQTIRRLLQDTAYAVEMAAYLDSMYAISQHQQPAPFLRAEEEGKTISKNARETNIATSIAGFYALECGLNYLVTTRHQLPSEILQSLQDGSMSREDKMIFARFANATWKAGQPFRGLNRITRPTFTSFYFLNEADIEKDMVQIKAAAQMLLPFL